MDPHARGERLTSHRASVFAGVVDERERLAVDGGVVRAHLLQLVEDVGTVDSVLGERLGRGGSWAKVTELGARTLEGDGSR